MEDGEPTSNDGVSHALGASAEPPWMAVAFVLGILGTLVSAVSGLVMITKRNVITCPDGTTFPNGTTDFNCYEHPDAALGVSIMALSVAVAAGLVLLRFLVGVVQDRAVTPA